MIDFANALRGQVRKR